MSMAPNNPFEVPPRDQGTGQGPPPAKSNSGWLIGCSIAAVVGLLVCCGGGVLLMRSGGQMFSQLIDSTLSTEYQSQLADNPVIVEHIGEIESMEFDMPMTFDEAQKAGERGEDPNLVFQITGSKGSGTVMVQQSDGGGNPDIQSATLVMSDGTRHDIDLAAGPSADLDLDLSEMFDEGDLDTGASDAGPIETDATETDATETDATETDATETDATDSGQGATPADVEGDSLELEKN